MEINLPILRTHWTVILALSVACITTAVTGRAETVPPGDSRPVVAQAIESYEAQPNVSGSVTIAGSETMKSMMTKLAAEFMRLHPSVSFTVEGTGSSAAIREFAMGISLQRRGDKAREGHGGGAAAQLLAASRELTDAETAAFRSHHGFAPIGIPVAMGAVTLFVHADNPIEGLTLAQLDAMFGTSRKRGAQADITTWGQVMKRSGWENQAIHLYGRNKESGTREFFVRAVLQGGELKNEIREQAGTASEILAIARDPLGIGYAGTGVQTSLARMVPIAESEGAPFVLPTQDSVTSGAYPLSRPLYLYVAAGQKQPIDPAILSFLRFVNSREGQEIAARSGFFPLTEAMVAKNRDLLVGVSLTARVKNDRR
ncbi:PstS family phosphate ABC transporter substrate-binding protein [Nitrospira moscoviensis]|uniref:Phosphate ABC transporter, periplasmic phosphate-binding protein n=1 Tax=Nitrospira moscoviensis TaxID=42253 RepID=A0A0K2GC49_NITMO|nr:PstS family phosphate ABC transporter substrate-binding protein [Nitrospira moscoviensis]ALA58536.1 Phosphate ABC transporter, periplasmic phosphate-binding protein [Nitrospira moscoviensis]